MLTARHQVLITGGHLEAFTEVVPVRRTIDVHIVKVVGHGSDASVVDSPAVLSATFLRVLDVAELAMNLVTIFSVSLLVLHHHKLLVQVGVVERAALSRASDTRVGRNTMRASRKQVQSMLRRLELNWTGMEHGRRLGSVLQAFHLPVQVSEVILRVEHLALDRGRLLGAIDTSIARHLIVNRILGRLRYEMRVTAAHGILL